MEAKDTVMSRDEQFKLSPEGAREALCIRQAEVSFKAGQKEAEDRLQARINAKRLVELDEDQTLPKLREYCHVDCGFPTQADMLEARFRKVREVMETGKQRL